MIRIRHLNLPAGLSALARRSPDGDLEIFVSDALEPLRQRAAVRVALRSSRQSGWRAGLLPVPLVPLRAVGISGLRAAARALRVHALASTAAATLAVAAAAALIIALPQHHVPLSAGKQPAAGRLATTPGPARSASISPSRSRSPHAAPTAGQLKPAVTPAAVPTAAASPSRTPTIAAPSASPVPTISGGTSTSPARSASPAPTRPASGGGTCLVLLGLRICL